MGENIKLKILSAKDFEIAAELLSIAMLDNPLHVAVFGLDRKKRKHNLYKFFYLLLPFIYSKGFLYGAIREEKLIGLLAVMTPGSCNFSLKIKLYLICKTFKLFGFFMGLKICCWLFKWHINDFKHNHWHLGPLAVDPNQRQQGIASTLLNKFLTQLNGLPIWLETDKSVNVDFYIKRGFVVHKEISILKVKNYFLLFRP